MAVYQNYLSDRVSKIGVLVVVALLTQLLFAAFVRPMAEEWRTEQRAIAERTPGYVPARSIWIIIENPEQEATIIVAIWAMILSAMRMRELRAQRDLLGAGYMRLDPGIVILPTDVREYLRQFEQLPPIKRDSVLPRVLAAALKQ